MSLRTQIASFYRPFFAGAIHRSLKQRDSLLVLIGDDDSINRGLIAQMLLLGNRREHIALVQGNEMRNTRFDRNRFAPVRIGSKGKSAIRQRIGNAAVGNAKAV